MANAFYAADEWFTEGDAAELGIDRYTAPEIVSDVAAEQVRLAYAINGVVLDYEDVRNYLWQTAR